MDRISALRNVEDALSDLESGDADLASVEDRIRGIVRTFATDYDGDLAAYRATGPDAIDGLVVLASSETAARTRIGDLAGESGELDGFDVERID